MILFLGYSVFFLSILSIYTFAMFPPVEKAAKEVISHPYPHGEIGNFFSEEFIDQLEKDYPKVTEEDRKRNRISIKSVLYLEPKYNEVIQRSAAYRALHDYVNSTEFLQWGIGLYNRYFEKGLLKYKCTIDPKKVFYEFFPEDFYDRNEINQFIPRKHGKNLPPGHDHNRIFARIDFTHGRNHEYTRPRHQDTVSRIMGIMIHFDSLNEEDGGAFEIFDKNGGQIVKKIFPKRNTAIHHLSGWVNAWHAGGYLNSTVNPKAQRRFVQIQLCAHQSICRG
jgi:hypothetical protein